MNIQQSDLSQSYQNDRMTEVDALQLLPSSLELQPYRTRASAPEYTPSKSLGGTFSSKVQKSKTTKGCLGCSTRLRTCAFIFALGLVGIIAIVLPTVLINTLVEPASTTSTTTESTTVTATTTSVASTTTTITTTTQTTSTTSTSTTTSVCGAGCAKVLISSWSRLAYYKFESNTNDETGVYPASGLSSPTYSDGYAGTAISLDATSSERLITSPMNLYDKSFTIELWFYLTGIATQDNAFFGQQSLSNVGKNCLFVMTRQARLYMGFYADDIVGSTVLQSNTWYHAAFVYDNDKRQQFIYLNGILDVQSATGVGPYLGTSGSMTIGSAKIDGTIGSPTFSGYLDQLIVTTRAKTACEILNDATLAAYFPFDGSFTDAGPNALPLTSSGASLTSGYTNQGVYLSGSNSYIQIGGLTSLGRSNYSYSIAFWIYPVVKGVLVHVSSNSTGRGWCTPLISFTPSGNIFTQVYNPGTANYITGPSLISSGWTHVIQTYSPINGQRLYINGILYASISASTIYQSSQSVDFLTFGNMLLGAAYCNNPSAVLTVFEGKIDEMRIFSRELSSIDACLLAQP